MVNEKLVNSLMTLIENNEPELELKFDNSEKKESARDLHNCELVMRLNEIHDITQFLGEIEDQIDTAKFLGLLEEIIQVYIDRGDFTQEYIKTKRIPYGILLVLYTCFI